MGGGGGGYVEKKKSQFLYLNNKKFQNEHVGKRPAIWEVIGIRQRQLCEFLVSRKNEHANNFLRRNRRVMYLIRTIISGRAANQRYQEC
jgi:hypothetical protein